MNILKKLSPVTYIFVCLFILVFFSGCSNATDNKTYQNINAKVAFELIQNKEVLILDVRTKGEYAQGHITDSVLIPVQVLSTDFTKIMDFKEKPILIYCRSGNRSVTSSNILLEKGFKDLYNLKGGIKDWVNKGYSIQK
jgi:phage shock protein E